MVAYVFVTNAIFHQFLDLRGRGFAYDAGHDVGTLPERGSYSLRAVVIICDIGGAKRNSRPTGDCVDSRLDYYR